MKHSGKQTSIGRHPRAGPEKIPTGGMLFDWGQFFYEFADFSKFLSKYVQILRKFMMS
jgi:hypothetical protein